MLRHSQIHLMCWGTGRERTPAEYAALLARAGWKYQQTWYPPTWMMGIVEGRHESTSASQR